MLEMLIVVAIIGIVAAISMPVGGAAVSSYKLSGQAHAISYKVSLAKMRAAASFSRARLFIDTAAGTYRLEVWNKQVGTTPGSWITDGGTEHLPRPIVFGVGSATAPPPNTQGASAFGLSSVCLDGVLPTSTAIANSNCVTFNSRGVPIDSSGAPTGIDAVYLSDGSAVFATTVSATGMTQLWWTPVQTTSWQRQ